MTPANYSYVSYPDYEYNYGFLYEMPFWNATRHTRNMSYDLRGDIPPLFYPTGPWNQSPRMF